jgi:hypothetical protein
MLYLAHGGAVEGTLQAGLIYFSAAYFAELRWVEQALFQASSARYTSAAFLEPAGIWKSPLLSPSFGKECCGREVAKP